MSPDRPITTRPPSSGPRSEVKGLWFVAARRYLLNEYDESVVASVITSMPADLREAMEEPLPSAWYPEEALQEAMRAVSSVVAMGNAERMLQLLEGCTLVGINHFWRTALRVATPTFALRALPTTWKHMRRGPGVLEVDVNREKGRVRYSRFPYFNDINYRLLVLGAVGPLLRISMGGPVRLTIVDFGVSYLTAEVDIA